MSQGNGNKPEAAQPKATIGIRVRCEPEDASDLKEVGCSCGWTFFPGTTKSGVVELVHHMMSHAEKIGRVNMHHALKQAGMLREEKSSIIIPGR